MSIGGKKNPVCKAPTKFVGLHAHSGFSTFDGLGYPQEHIDYVLENEMDSWALTDHGHMNGYAHAFLHSQKIKKAGKNFKFIPGCEMYIHPDLDDWKKQLSESKSKNKSAIDESIVSNIVRETDEDDETTDVVKEDVSLTVENEEESKSSKHFDPLKRRHHLVVIPKTSVGLERLFHLVSRGYLEGFYRFPRVDYRMLKEAAAGGHLMISSACLGGHLSWEVFQKLQQVEFDDLDYRLLDDKSLLKDILLSVGNAYEKMCDAVGRENAYLELQFNKLSAQHVVNRALIEFAKQNSLQDRLLVTCDSHYSRPEHWKERELYKKLGWLNFQNFDPNLLPKAIEDLKCELYPKNSEQVWDTYLKTTEGMDFYDDQFVKEAIERTYDIAHNEIGDIVPNRVMKLPSYVVPEGMNDNKALLAECKRGLEMRGFQDNQEYIDRIKSEFEIIKNMKFSRYFLTMKAIIDIAKKRMLTAPGRGSAGGSLIAYVLGITNIDPIEYGLSFYRFLNPARQGYPDIDTDVADRDLLINLLRDSFGSDNVIPISNYNTFKLKSLIKDISRFYGIPFDEVNAALSTVEDDVKRATFKPGTDKNLFVLEYEDAMKYSKTLNIFIESHPEVADPIKILFKQNRSLGRHAGGVIVSENIKERLPLILAKGEPQTPWVEGMHYKHLEEFGWVKFDLLGLETLRIIERCIALILQRKEGIENPTFDQVRAWFDTHMDPKKIDLNDQHVYKHVYHEGRFCGIFQITQQGAQRLFMKAKPCSIIDIATLTSIYRPGPLGANVDKLYVDAKNNKENLDYRHPLIKKVLESTYNCIAGDTLVLTESGEITIKEIVDSNLVGIKLPSYNESTNDLEEDEIVAVKYSGVKDTITLELENGNNIRLTSDHLVKTTRIENDGWIKAGDLTVEDEILCLND